MTNHQKSLSCVTCGILGRNDAPSLHCWQHNQCRKCHYFGIIPKGKISKKWESKPIHGKIEKHYTPITTKNVELYCILSKIIRGKPCRSKSQVLMKQEQYRIVLP